MAGDRVGREDGVGARAAHLGLRAFLGRARSHEDAGVDPLCRKQHEQVFGIAGQRGHQPAGALDSDLAEDLVASGVRSHGQQPIGHGLLGALRADVHHHEWNTGALQFSGRAAAHAAESTNNVVIFQIVDHAFIAPFPDGFPEFQFDDGLGHDADGDENSRDPESEQKGVENAARAAKRQDFRVAHCGHGDERHVERVERRVVIDDGETSRADGQRCRDG